MKIKLSKSQWEDAGRKAGWINTIASLAPEILEKKLNNYVKRIMKGEPFEEVMKYEDFSIKRKVGQMVSQQLSPNKKINKTNKPKFSI